MKSNQIIKEYLDKYMLKSGKKEDYLGWRELLQMMERKEHLTSKGKERVIEIKRAMSISRK